jgi:hypothetical protein
MTKQDIIAGKLALLETWLQMQMIPKQWKYLRGGQRYINALVKRIETLESN